MTLSNKEALTLLRIGLEEETDLPVLVLADVDIKEFRNAETQRADSVNEARESTKKHALRAETSKGLRRVETTGDSRGGQFISPIPSDRGLLLLATLP